MSSTNLPPVRHLLLELAREFRSARRPGQTLGEWVGEHVPEVELRGFIQSHVSSITEAMNSPNLPPVRRLLLELAREFRSVRRPGQTVGEWVGEHVPELERHELRVLGVCEIWYSEAYSPSADDFEYRHVHLPRHLAAHLRANGELLGQAELYAIPGIRLGPNWEHYERWPREPHILLLRRRTAASRASWPAAVGPGLVVSGAPVAHTSATVAGASAPGASVAAAALPAAVGEGGENRAPAVGHATAASKAASSPPVASESRAAGIQVGASVVAAMVPASAPTVDGAPGHKAAGAGVDGTCAGATGASASGGAALPPAAIGGGGETPPPAAGLVTTAATAAPLPPGARAAHGSKRKRIRFKTSEVCNALGVAEAPAGRFRPKGTQERFKARRARKAKARPPDDQAARKDQRPASPRSGVAESVQAGSHRRRGTKTQAPAEAAADAQRSSRSNAGKHPRAKHETRRWLNYKDSVHCERCGALVRRDNLSRHLRQWCQNMCMTHPLCASGMLRL